MAELASLSMASYAKLNADGNLILFRRHVGWAVPTRLLQWADGGRAEYVVRIWLSGLKRLDNSK
jgi:hypothetical protein